MMRPQRLDQSGKPNEGIERGSMCTLNLNRVCLSYSPCLTIEMHRYHLLQVFMQTKEPSLVPATHFNLLNLGGGTNCNRSQKSRNRQLSSSPFDLTKFNIGPYRSSLNTVVVIIDIQYAYNIDMA